MMLCYTLAEMGFIITMVFLIEFGFDVLKMGAKINDKT